MNQTPRLIALEVTRSCPLNCIHCRAGATYKHYENELTFEEIKKILADISLFSKPVIILTGGEPLNRKDIFDIAACGRSTGLTMVLATCGYNLNSETLEKLKASGISRLSFSLDGPDSKTHDAFRGVKDSFEHIINAAKQAQKLNIPFQINTTVTKKNYKLLDEIIELSIGIGAEAVHPFFLVPTGRAKDLIGLEINAGEYEKTLKHLHKISEKNTIVIKPTCAPQYHRITGTKSKSCLAGTGFAFISHIGKVQTCGFLDIECGDLRREDYRFEKIWRNSVVFNRLREKTNYTGKCGICSYYDCCGGCRARAYEASGDYTAEEPNCVYNK